MDRPERVKGILLRPLPWVLLFGGLIAYGVYALLHIPVEVLPRFHFPEISVVTHYPGATAGELETLIARPLEGRILGLQDLVSVRSTMGNGTVETDIRFGRETDPRQDLQAVNGAIDRARADLPAAARPYAEIMGNAINEVADYTVHIPDGVTPVTVQRAIRTVVVPALRALPGVQRAEVYGSGDESLWVQPQLDALRRYDVPVTAIVDALRQQVLVGPSGYVRQGYQDLLVEARHLPVRADEVERIPVPGPHGPIPLRALARVVRGPLPTRSAVSLDGRPSIALVIFKQPGASTVPATQAVEKCLAETLPQLPPGVRWLRTYDQGHLVRIVGADLGRNLLVGAGLAVAGLFWILGAGRGIWMLALSIPLSLLTGIAVLHALGQSLNLMTLGALTVAVGMLADDAVIVLESIYHRWEQGAGQWEGIWQGLGDIASPDVTGTMTTVAVFAPLVFVGGLAGLFFIPFALSMAGALLASLVVSLSLIPLGLGFFGAGPRLKPTLAGRALDGLRERNERLLGRVLRHPRLSLSICGALFAVSLVALALVPVHVLPLPNEGVLLESFTLPPGTSLAETESVVAQVTERLRTDPAVSHTFVRIGSPAGSSYTEPGYAGEIQIVLKAGVAVNSLDRIGERLLRVSRTPGVLFSLDTPTLERVGESLSGLPQPFVVRLFGDRLETLRTLSEEVTRRLRRVPELTDIFNNDGYPVTQLQILPRAPALSAYGMSPTRLYDQLRPLLAGEIVADVPDGNYHLPLYVRLADAPDQSLPSLRALPIRTAGWTRLGALAEVRLVPSSNQIRHIDGARALEILATPRGALGDTIRAAGRELASLQLPLGYRIGFGGLFRELERAAIDLAAAGVAAFLLMAGILVLQFDGLLIPGLLLLQIPLAFTGGAAALALSGVGLNATGVVAFLTLVGISLNHGIVLLYRVRRNEAAGLAPEAAVREAVHVRFRPIMLTTLAAVLGMLPTALGWGEGAAPEQGLAVVILGGVLWSAVLSTNLIPALYVYRRTRRSTVRASAATTDIE